MYRLLRSALTTFYQLIALLNGSTSVREVFHHNRSIGSLYVKAFDGYELEVFCFKRQYLIKRQNSFFKGKIHTVFDVHCKISGEPPPMLIKVCQTKITFPPLIPVFLEESFHVHVLVNAYLDLIQRLLHEELVRDK